MTNPSFLFERQYTGLVIGVDEVGLGCWAGDVFAAAAYVPYETPVEVLACLQDSKKISALKRDQTLPLFKRAGIQYAIGQATLAEIEQHNIRGAALIAMERSIDALMEMMPAAPVMALVDGTMQPSAPCPTTSLIKGDQKSYSIAAASIAAKVTRDGYMAQIAQDYPAYGWDKNAGYGTKLHQDALKEYGVTPYHRCTYAPIRKLLEAESA